MRSPGRTGQRGAMPTLSTISSVTGAAANVEGFVHRVRPPSVEEARRRGDRCREVDPGRRRAGVGSSQVHAVLITRHHLADKPEGWGSSLA